MKDYIIRSTAADGQVRAFCAVTKETVGTAAANHNTSPVVTAALGRLLTAGAMMGSMMKGDEDVLTIRVEGDGPMKSLLVTADSHGSVKGYPGVSNVDLPPNSIGKLDVAGAIGKGFLTVIKDIGLKEPYSGTCELITGEIAEDLTYYFASSEQTPSSVGLGVLVDKDCSVKEAGGFIIQIMPDALDETITAIENNLATVTSVTDLLSDGNSPEDILEIILKGLNPQVLDRIPVGFKCNCSRKRVSDALMLLSKADLDSIVEEGKDIEIKCHFCNTAYNFSVEEIENLRNS